MGTADGAYYVRDKGETLKQSIPFHFKVSSPLLLELADYMQDINRITDILPEWYGLEDVVGGVAFQKVEQFLRRKLNNLKHNAIQRCMQAHLYSLMPETPD